MTIDDAKPFVDMIAGVCVNETGNEYEAVPTNELRYKITFLYEVPVKGCENTVVPEVLPLTVDWVILLAIPNTKLTVPEFNTRIASVAEVVAAV